MAFKLLSLIIVLGAWLYFSPTTSAACTPTDLRTILTSWGSASGPADLDSNGIVNSLDWGSACQSSTSASLQSATAHTELPASDWVFPLTPALQTQLLAMMDSVLAQAKTAYGAGQPKIVMLENSTSLLSDFAAKAQQAFPGALVVGVGPGNANYNAFTTQTFSEHDQRSLAVLALGGSSITRVQASGQYPVGQGSVAQQQIDAGSLIAQNLKPLLLPNQRNLIHFFGPGHNPNHKLILCGFKQGMAGVTNKCNPATPDNPDLPGLPQLPSYVHIIGASSYYGGNTAVGTSVVSRSAIGVLIQGTFRMSMAGLAGTPNATNILPLINQITLELGGTPQHIFLVPGHPAVGGYEAFRLGIVNRLPSTTIFGHEGGGEIGHDTLTASASAVTLHLFMTGLRGN